MSLPPLDPELTPSVLLRDVRIVDVDRSGAPSGPVDVRIEGGLVVAVGCGLSAEGAQAHDAGGAYAIPGLWDQHVHMGQWAMATERMDTAGARSPDEVLARLAPVVAAAPAGTTIQGWGHRTATWSRQPTVAELDAVSGDHPVVLISGDAHHAWANTRALQLLGLAARAGVVAEEEWFTAFPRLLELPGVVEARERGMREVVRAANAAGIVGIGDMEFSNDAARLWPGRVGAGLTSVRVRECSYEGGLDGVLAAGWKTGDALPGGRGLAIMGPLKLISDGSLNTRTAFCCAPYAGDPDGGTGVQNYPPERLRGLLQRAQSGGLEYAVHAIGDAAVRDAIATIASLHMTGAIEHAQLLGTGDALRMAAAGIRASVQPAHLLDDRDVMERLWPDRGARCFPLRDLLDAGVDVRLGSDAPVSPLDPWLEMAAAVHRSADDRPAWHPEQAISAAEALACSTDGQGPLRVGSRGDVVLLESDPTTFAGDSAEIAARLRAVRPLATFLGGREVYAR